MTTEVNPFERYADPVYLINAADITGSGATVATVDNIVMQDTDGTLFFKRVTGETPPVITNWKLSDGTSYTITGTPVPYVVATTNITGNVEITNDVGNAIPVNGAVLDNIKTKTDNIPVLGQALAALSSPVVLPQSQIDVLATEATLLDVKTALVPEVSIDVTYSAVDQFPVGASTASFWNTQFSLDNIIKSVAVVDTTIKLYPVAKFQLGDSIFDDNNAVWKANKLVSFIDNGNYITALGNQCFRYAFTNGYGTIILQLNGVEKIGIDFCKESLIQNAYLDSVIQLKDGAFFNCSLLAIISFLRLEVVGNMFAGGSSLEELTLPNVTTVGDNFCANSKIYYANMASLEIAGDGFMQASLYGIELIAPKLRSAGTAFLNSLKSYSDINIASIESVGSSSFIGQTAQTNNTFLVNNSFAKSDTNYKTYKAANTIVETISDAGDYGQQTAANSKSVVLASDSMVTTNFDKTHTSAFDDLIVTKLEPLVQLTFIHGINNQTGSVGTPLNSAAGDTNLGRLRLQSGTNSAGAIAFIGKKPVVYRAAEGMEARFTTVFDSPITSNMRLWGIASYTPSASNTTFVDFYGVGFYVGTDSTSTTYTGILFGFLHRSNSGGSVVDRFYPLVQWSDKLDGTGASGDTLDITKGNLWTIKYPFQGYGNIRLERESSITSEYVLALTIPYANANTNIQLSNPSLVPYGINVNSGNTTNKAMYCGSFGIFLTGERRYLGAFFGAKNNKTGTIASLNVLSLKTATTYNGSPFQGLIKLKSVSLAWDGTNDICSLEVLKNATSLGGTPAFTGRDGTITTGTGATTIAGAATITSGNSVVAVDTAGTTVTGGTVHFNTTVARNSSTTVDLTDFDLYLAVGESFTFATSSPAAGGSVSVTVNWTELTG